MSCILLAVQLISAHELLAYRASSAFCLQRVYDTMMMIIPGCECMYVLPGMRLSYPLTTHTTPRKKVYDCCCCSLLLAAFCCLLLLAVVTDPSLSRAKTNTIYIPDLELYLLRTYTHHPRQQPTNNNDSIKVQQRKTPRTLFSPFFL